MNKNSPVLFRQMQVWNSVFSRKLETNGSSKTHAQNIVESKFLLWAVCAILPLQPPAVVAPSCKLTDPGAYHCPFLTPCQVHPGCTPTPLCAIASTKLKPECVELMIKCSDHFCCLDHRWSEILRTAAKDMHRSVLIQVLRSLDRKESNSSFPHALLCVV